MSPAVAIDAERLFSLYERDAERYCDSLPLEHFMESTTQAMQRKITLESLDLVAAVWPDFQVFSELLIQYPLADEDIGRPERVVPDNMVIVHPEPIKAQGSFMVPLQPVGPTLVLEYISKESRRKDYEDNRRKYGQELKVPYYLLFDPDNRSLLVFHLIQDEYVVVEANSVGRLEIPDLDLEAAIHDGWVRFWFRGELLPLPGVLLNSLKSTERLLRVERRERTVERAAAEERLAAEHAARVSERIAAERLLAEERTAKRALEEEISRLREALAEGRKS